MQRWLLSDTRSSDTHRLAANPKTMGSPHLKNATTTTGVDATGRRRVLRAPAKPVPWKFEGRLRSQDEYAALELWSRKPGRIQITDHLGRVHEVLPTSFDPVPARNNGVPNPWIFDYAFNALYLRRVS